MKISLGSRSLSLARARATYEIRMAIPSLARSPRLAGEKGLEKRGGIVGHEIAASWVLKQLVKLRMAREREKERESTYESARARERERETRRIYRIGKIDASPDRTFRVRLPGT